MSVSATCEQTLRDGQVKFYHLVAARDEDWFDVEDQLRYDLGFREWQDDLDAKTRAVRKMGLRTARADDFSSVLVRALSLFRPGELRALRVPADVDVFQLVASLVRTSPQLERALDGLCAIHAGGHCSVFSDIGSLATLLERHSSTLTELDAELPPKMLQAAAAALARCTRLEFLTEAAHHNPAIWLELSNLHTLRDVDLSKVSTAAIAAALPKLHTLDAFVYRGKPAQVAGFFTDLLPRLRVFQFEGNWPDLPEEHPASPIVPLPLLEELMWDLPHSHTTRAPRAADDLAGFLCFHFKVDALARCIIEFFITRTRFAHRGSVRGRSTRSV